jgi:beta-galactosidase
VGSEYFNKMMVEMKGQQQQVVTQPIAKVLSEDAYAALDIAGYNYADNRYLRDAEEYPERISVGTETLPPKIGINWKIIEQCPNVLGDFMWTGWDYLGEAGVGAYVYDSVGNKNGAFPALLAGSGVIDICGHCRPEVYLNQVAYGLEKGPFLSVEPINHSKEDHLISAWRYSDSIRSWSWEGYEGNPANLVIYGMGAYVEVFLNENKIGRADFKGYKAVLDTVYEPGEIKAVSYDEKGQEIGRDILRTASDKTQIQMTLSKEEVRAEDVEICYVDLALTDEDGLWKPGAEAEMRRSLPMETQILSGMERLICAHSRLIMEEPRR